jgi:mRNA-degrading endonuclease YafQ of YafQ-DinJ toxin-antitoxin module
MTIYHTSRFRRSYKNLDRQLKSAAQKRVALFRLNRLDRRLRTHSLHGPLKDIWSFSVDARYRILFEFIDSRREQVIFLDVGNHSLYQ